MFAPNLCERSDQRGKLVESQNRADAAAEYLADKQWGAPTEPTEEEQAFNDNHYKAERNT